MNQPQFTDDPVHNPHMQQENLSVAFLLQMLNGIPDPIFVKDSQHRWVFLNNAFCNFMGCSREELLGKSDYDFFPKQEADIFWEKDELVLTTGNTNENEEQLTDASGVTYVISTKKSLFEDEAGNKFLVCTIRDITQNITIDRKQAEEALKESEKKYRDLVETSQDMIWSVDTQGRFTFVNEAVRCIYGYEPEEMIGRPFTDFESPEQIQKDLEMHHRIIFGESLFQYETVHITKDGKRLNLLFNAIALRDAEGNVVGTTGTASNITESKLVEKEQATLVAILEATSDFVSIANASGYITYMNSAGRRMLGIGEDEDITKIHFTQTHPSHVIETMPKEMPKLWQDSTWTRESFLLHRNGTEIPVSIVIMVHRSQSGEVEFNSVIAHDITERKRAEDTLRKSESRLRQQAKELEQALDQLQRTQIHLVQTEKMSSLGQLVAGIAHEINNPVNFIYGNLTYADAYTQELLRLLQLYHQHYPNPVLEIQDFAEAIDLDFLKSDLAQILNSMKVGAERIQQIVLSLRTFSRLDEAEMKTVDIHEGIDSTLMILQSRLNANSSRPAIEVIKEYSNLPLVDCYAGQLNQVFMNILVNAIDALEESFVEDKGQRTNPEIWIRTELVEQNQVTICIRDNGPGMPEEVKQLLFDPFFTTKPVGKGTGLGLSISYQIVTEGHGGSLQCISEPGKGAEFVITIPLVQS